MQAVSIVLPPRMCLGVTGSGLFESALSIEDCEARLPSLRPVELLVKGYLEATKYTSICYTLKRAFSWFYCNHLLTKLEL